MIEEPELPDAPNAPGGAREQDAPAGKRSAGAMLREIRQSGGVDATLVASALKISPQMLEDLERDRYKALPDLAFARSLAASICRNFGVDPKPVLAQMPQTLHNALPVPGRGINAPFYSATDRPRAALPKYVTRPLTVIVALFLLGSLLLWLWPTLPIRLGDAPHDGDEVTQAQQTLTSAEIRTSPTREPPVAQTVTSAPDVGQETAPAGSADGETAAAGVTEPDAADAQERSTHSGAEEPSEAQDTAAGTPVDDTVAVEPMLAVPGAADADMDKDKRDTTSEAGAVPDVADAADLDDLVIAANAESWVSVRDAAGQTLYNGLLEGGETARVSGAKPLAATIGRKDAVTVLVHGQPFDHRSLSTTSVSRFKVD